MERNWPPYVKKYLTALGKPAQTRWESSETHRSSSLERSLALVENPWETKFDEVPDTKEFLFLRDFFNLSYECVNSCHSLDLVAEISGESLVGISEDKIPQRITFWTEAYLNEVYIFQLRVLDLITFIQRRYKKDEDFTDFVEDVGKSLKEFVLDELDPVIVERGKHVHKHRNRNSDPELARLHVFVSLIDALGISVLDEKRRESILEATTWLQRQVSHYSDLCWHLLNEVCRGFSEGILLENDHMIVPINYKDDPAALAKLREARAPN